MRSASQNLCDHSKLSLPGEPLNSNLLIYCTSSAHSLLRFATSQGCRIIYIYPSSCHDQTAAYIQCAPPVGAGHTGLYTATATTDVWWPRRPVRIEVAIRDINRLYLSAIPERLWAQRTPHPPQVSNATSLRGDLSRNLTHLSACAKLG